PDRPRSDPGVHLLERYRVRRGRVRAASGGESAPVDRRLLVLDPQAAGALLRGSLRLRHRGGVECTMAPLDHAILLRVGGVPPLRSADARRALRCGIRRGAYRAPRGTLSPLSPAPAVGRELPGELRGPRLARRRRGRARRRPRRRRDALVRAGDRDGPGERFRPRRGTRERTRCALLLGAGNRETRTRLFEGGAERLPAVGGRGQGAPARSASSTPRYK